MYGVMAALMKVEDLYICSEAPSFLLQLLRIHVALLLPSHCYEYSTSHTKQNLPMFRVFFQNTVSLYP